MKAQQKPTKTPKIASLGAAVQDVFLMGEVLRARRDVRTHDFVEQFPLGAKLELDRVVFSTGGGATNAAVTFARHGFDSIFLGKIGDDPAGEHILADLKRDGVITNRVTCDIEGVSGYSTLLLAPRGERTVLVYRGVSQELKAADFNHFEGLKADWLYISSLSGNFPLLSEAVAYAKKHDMKLALNPGSEELKQSKRLLGLLSDVTVVSLNKEEAQLLIGDGETAQLAEKLAQHAMIAVVTDGPRGAYACDGEYIYSAGMYADTPVIDRTGAGDAFTSGFIAKIAKGASVEEALIFGSANSTSVVGQIGAKEGILSHMARLKPMEITKKTLKTKEKTHAK